MHTTVRVLNWYQQGQQIKLDWLRIWRLQFGESMYVFEFIINYVNPKWCGLFGQLRMRGESKSAQWEIAVFGCFNFYPRSTNSASYESWQLQLKFETSVRSLKLIVWPQEVSEVTEVKMKKILDKILKLSVFDLEKCCIPQKNPHKNRHSYKK